MQEQMSPPFRLMVWGEYACFTRPEMKVERVSYEVMTPSAARGILEAVLWKPQMFWQVERIDVLHPVRFDRIRRNEVSKVMPTKNAIQAMRGSDEVDLGMDIESERTQRSTLMLRDVKYVITARIGLTEKAGEKDSIAKYAEMFMRRARVGQCAYRPYLGTREFACEFRMVEKEEKIAPIRRTQELGRMLHDIQFGGKTPTPVFFDAKMVNGSVEVPPFDRQGAVQ